MSTRRHAVLAMLVYMACQPPMQRSVTVPARAEATTTERVSESAATTHQLKSPHARVSSWVDTAQRTFKQIDDDQVMFTQRVPKQGWYTFCMKGSKPLGYRFSYHVTIELSREQEHEGVYRCQDDTAMRNCPAGTVWQVDHFVMVYESESEINACLQMDASELQLQPGQEVQFRSRFATVGPVTVSASYQQVDP